MRRFYISLMLFLTLVAVCIYSLYSIHSTINIVLVKLDAVMVHVEEDEHETAVELLNKLNSDWPDIEDRMIRLMKHNDLDTITLTLARLPALLKHGDMGEFMAEVSLVRTLLEHIWDSELPGFENIF